MSETVKSWMRLFIKRLLFPGIDLGTRERVRLAKKYLRAGNVYTLDAGCGNGALSLEAYRKGNRVLGIDLDPTNVQSSRQYAEYLGIDPDRCRFELCNVYDLPERGDQFDQIICFELLEHIYNDQELLGVFHKVLRPGGLLHISTPRADRKPYYGESFEKGGHVRLGYTHEQMEALLTEAGFIPVCRDVAIGPGALKGLEAVYWSKFHLGLAGAVGAFVMLYPLTLIDRLFPSAPRLSIYVMARRP